MPSSYQWQETLIMLGILWMNFLTSSNFAAILLQELQKVAHIARFWTVSGFIEAIIWHKMQSAIKNRGLFQEGLPNTILEAENRWSPIGIFFYKQKSSVMGHLSFEFNGE
jgi:hypothetical protein